MNIEGVMGSRLIFEYFYGSGTRGPVDKDSGYFSSPGEFGDLHGVRKHNLVKVPDGLVKLNKGEAFLNILRNNIIFIPNYPFSRLDIYTSKYGIREANVHISFLEGKFRAANRGSASDLQTGPADAEFSFFFTPMNAQKPAPAER